MMRNKIEKTKAMGEDSKLITVEGVENPLKIDLPSCDGKRNIEIFLDWVKKYRELLQLYEYARKKEGSISSNKS